MGQSDTEPTLFVPPIRMRVGDSIGLIRSVTDALDWIDHLRGNPRARFEEAAIRLRQAARSRSAADVAEARSTFVNALFLADLLHNPPPRPVRENSFL